MDMRMTKSVSKGSVNGPSKSGGTNSHTFVKDGGISYLGQLPTWVFTLSVHLARPSQTCWSIPHVYHSTSPTIYEHNGEPQVQPRQIPVLYAFSMTVGCWHLDWQVSSAAQIFNTLSQVLLTVEHLTFDHKVHRLSSSEEHNVVDRAQWCQLLRSFRNVKTLRITDGLVRELSRCVQLNDGEHPLELLPELQELTFSGGNDVDNAFTTFIDARQNAG